MNDCTYVPDPAAIFAAAISLWEACENNDEKDARAYHGYDNLMRQVMKVATLFETWSCKHIDFEELSDCWPYLLESEFGSSCLKLLESNNLDSFDELDCLRLSMRLKLPVLARDGLAVPINVLADNPIKDAYFVRFQISTMRVHHEDNAAEPYRLADEPNDPDFGVIYFATYGLGADSRMEHISDRSTYAEAIDLVTKLVPGIKFPSRPVLSGSIQ